MLVKDFVRCQLNAPSRPGGWLADNAPPQPVSPGTDEGDACPPRSNSVTFRYSPGRSRHRCRAGAVPAAGPAEESPDNAEHPAS